MRVFYVPPETRINPDTGKEEPFPPFIFTMSGTDYKFESPHAYHKKVREKYAVGVLVNETTGKPRLDVNGNPKVHYAERDKIVVDEEKTAEFKAGLIRPPQNYLDCTKVMLEELRRGMHKPFAQYLKREDDIVKEHRNSYEELKSSHFKEIDDLKKQLEAEGIKLREAVELAKKHRIEAVENFKETVRSGAPKKRNVQE